MTATLRNLNQIDVNRFTKPQLAQIAQRAFEAAEMTAAGFITECWFSASLAALVDSAFTVTSTSKYCTEYTVVIQRRVNSDTYHVMVQPYAGDAFPRDFKPMTLTRVTAPRSALDGAIRLDPGWN